MTFDNLKEMNAGAPMQVGVEFKFEDCDIRIPEIISAKVDSVSIEENEQMLYKFLSELRFKMKINLLTSKGKKFFSSDAIVTPNGDFKINYSETEKLMSQGTYTPEPTESQLTFFYSNGITKRSEGIYLDGKKHGLVKEFYPTGLIKSVGQYQNNAKHDKKFQEFSDSGELKFFGVYEHGKRLTNLCEWVETEYKKDLDSDINNLKNCIRYFDNGKKDPKQIVINKYDDLKIKSIEYWDEDKKQSIGTILHENGGVKYQGRTVNGFPDNETGKMYHDNGKVKYKGQIVQGKKHGKGELYHQNEVIMYKGRFHDDKIDDNDCSIYHDNYELKFRGMMKQGKMHGDGVKVYSKTGKIQFFGKVIEGAFIYGKIYHHNANIKYDGVLLEDCGIGNGHVKIFHDNGNLYYEGFYKSNQKNGHGKEYHYNGVLKYEGNFINDQIDGDNVTIYFDTGQFYYIGKVKNGLFHDKGKISLYKNGEANDTHKKTLNPEYKDGFLHNTDNKIAYMSPGNVFRYNGDFKNGKKEGNGSLYNVGEWDDSIEKYNTFTIYEGEWRDDLPYADEIIFNKMFHPDKKHFKGWIKRAKDDTLYGECELYNMRQQILFRGKYKAPNLTSIIAGSWDMQLEPFEEQAVRMF